MHLHHLLRRCHKRICKGRQQRWGTGCHGNFPEIRRRQQGRCEVRRRQARMQGLLLLLLLLGLSAPVCTHG
ncbi:hypothetical protein DPMN_082487 [Dreissena polymorpha]|uniref:Uncharacterized protein n=1 Tax=Dreissena polymorpha TaxID=45954 RepID=A0A9D3YAP5_DREPO|nr:hypothetical protein DPMN_082487 [Dreissena polymorpha]